jgi:hypothetical protein
VGDWSPAGGRFETLGVAPTWQSGSHKT